MSQEAKTGEVRQNRKARVGKLGTLLAGALFGLGVGTAASAPSFSSNLETSGQVNVSTNLGPSQAEPQYDNYFPRVLNWDMSVCPPFATNSEQAALQFSKRIESPERYRPSGWQNPRTGEYENSWVLKFDKAKSPVYRQPCATIFGYQGQDERASTHRWIVAAPGALPGGANQYVQLNYGEITEGMNPQEAVCEIVKRTQSVFPSPPEWEIIGSIQAIDFKKPASCKPEATAVAPSPRSEPTPTPGGPNPTPCDWYPCVPATQTAEAQRTIVGLTVVPSTRTPEGATNTPVTPIPLPSYEVSTPTPGGPTPTLCHWFPCVPATQTRIAELTGVPTGEPTNRPEPATPTRVPLTGSETPCHWFPCVPATQTYEASRWTPTPATPETPVPTQAATAAAPCGAQELELRELCYVSEPGDLPYYRIVDLWNNDLWNRGVMTATEWSMVFGQGEALKANGLGKQWILKDGSCTREDVLKLQREHIADRQAYFNQFEPGKTIGDVSQQRAYEAQLIVPLWAACPPTAVNGNANLRVNLM